VVSTVNGDKVDVFKDSRRVDFGSVTLMKDAS